MFLLSLLKTRDYLGSKVGFTINSNDTHQTVFGGFLSVLLSSLYVYFFIIFAEDMFFKKNPVGFDQIKPNLAIDSKFDFNRGFFLAGFQLINWDAKPYNLTEYFFPIFQYKEFHLDEKGEFHGVITELDTILCNEHKWGVTPMKSGIFKLNEFYCPDLSTLGDKKLYGDFNSEKLSYVSFKLSLCNKDKTECKDIKKVMDFFEKNEVFISTIYPKIQYYIDDQHDPFEKKFHNHYVYFSNHMFLLEEYTFQRYQLDEDKGNLFEDITSHDLIGINKILPLTDIRGKEILEKNLKEPQLHRYEMYYMAEIFYDKNMKYHFRKYLKLPDIFANVGGMMDFVSLFIVFFIILIYLRPT